MLQILVGLAILTAMDLLYFIFHSKDLFFKVYFKEANHEKWDAGTALASQNGYLHI